MKKLTTACPHCGNPASYRPSNAGNKTCCQKCLAEFHYPIDQMELLAQINDSLTVIKWIMLSGFLLLFAVPFILRVLQR